MHNEPCLWSPHFNMLVKAYIFGWNKRKLKEKDWELSKQWVSLRGITPKAKLLALRIMK